MEALLEQAGFIDYGETYIHPNYPNDEIKYNMSSFHINIYSEFGKIVLGMLFKDKMSQYQKLVEQLERCSVECEEFVSCDSGFEIIFHINSLNKFIDDDCDYIMVTHNATVKKDDSNVEYDDVYDLLDNEFSWKYECDDMRKRFKDRIKVLKKQIKRLEAENADLKYRPGGPGAEAARVHFDQLCEQN